MSSTSEALVQLAEQKEQLRIIANRYLDDADKLPVNCTLQDIIDVLNEYDEYSYMNAFLNSIEVFPDKDYSIDDREGHIKGLRPYAFYGNTALKSVLLAGIMSIDFYNSNFFVNASNLKKVSFPNLLSLNQAAFGVTSTTNVHFPKLNTITAGNQQYASLSCATLLIGGQLSTWNMSGFGISSLRYAFILTNSTMTTMSRADIAIQFNKSVDLHIYVPYVLLSDYQSATNWVTVHQAKTDEQGNYNGIQDIESHINDLRELGVDFSYTPYANKKWENNQLVDDSTIGEEVDE